jgi:hypothetical protein
MDSDITGAILVEIRNQLRGLEQALQSFKEGVEGSFGEVKAEIAQVGRRIDMSNRHLLTVEARFSTEIGALRADLHDRGAI